MASKYFCDRCDEEIDIDALTDDDCETYRSICLDAQDNEDHRMLCLKCFNLLVEFIDGKEDDI